VKVTCEIVRCAGLDAYEFRFCLTRPDRDPLFGALIMSKPQPQDANWRAVRARELGELLTEMVNS
jgi:hypothetical protein